MKNKILFGFLVGMVLVLSLFFVLRNQKDSIGENTTDIQKIKVATSIFPLYDIVKNVGGGLVEVTLILPPGASPHTFEATAEDIKKISNTEVFFVMGAKLDDWVKNLANTSAPLAPIFSMENSVNLISFEDLKNHAHEDEIEKDHDHEGVDPHFWLDPENAKLMALAVKENLVKLDPLNEGIYTQNTNNFINLIDQKDKEWKEKISTLENKKIAVFHDAWNYFSKHFDLEVVATFEPFPGKTPSPKYIIEMTNVIKENNLKYVFVEPQLSRDVVDSLSKDIGVGVGVLDPLGGFSGRNTYIEMIEYNVNQIFESLKGY